uniref:Uncharacterized protein n=1 Tax=Cyphia angustiloba TaxID=2041112 RepID=A0A291F2F6_9ASTR|nr:hypothetical protein Cyp_ang1Pt0223 [Cyphia angustiloba]ATG26299.1 hypothetical protein Cyp_ang1Pt0223 [Cyphia angustiloba]
MSINVTRVLFVIYVPSFLHFHMKLAISYFFFFHFMRASKLMFRPYSLDYIPKLVFYSHKLIQTTFNMKMLWSEISFIDKEYRSLTYNIKPPLLCEIISQSSLAERAIALEDGRELDRRRKKISSLKDRVNAIDSKFSFLSDKKDQNIKAIRALSHERDLIENALEEQFSIYAYKCKTNSLKIELEIALMGWLKQNEEKLRKRLNTAGEKYARYTNGGQKRNILGVFFLYYSLEYIAKLFYYEIKLLINGIKLKKLSSYRKFINTENNSVVAEEAKFRSEELSHERARKNLLEKYDYQGAAKLQREYDRQRFSRQEKEFSINKKFSVLEDKWIITNKKLSSLFEEQNGLSQALEDLIYIYEDRFRNTFERKTFRWLNQTEIKIRYIMYTAIEEAAAAWDKK